MSSNSGRQKVFISYAREDVDSAQRMYRDLKANGLDAWLDKEDLLPGDEWRPAITAAIRKCDYFLALLSSNSVQKTGYVQKELREALAALDQLPQGKKYLIPARLDECKPSYDRLSDLNWVDLFPSWETGLNRIVVALNGTPALKNVKSAKKVESKAGTRLQLEMTPEAMKALSELQNRTEAETRADLFRQALAVLDYLSKQAAEGNKLLIERDGTLVEIVMPILEPHRATMSEIADFAVDSRE
jgi:hypothetical protein